MPGLELWVGPECTVNRVGNEFRDQLAETGVEHRLDDLDRIAGLGVRHLRWPLLWERSAKDLSGRYDWRWCDSRVQRMRELGLECVAGLVHHGSGPSGTHLLDPAFAEGLARYAGAVARRYPHLAAYTPVNEPLTTARFSALYGVWYPHRSDDAGFVRAVLHQLRATVLAMREVRRVNPAALLVQTDDLGFTHATPGLQYQADFENLRRWLGFDILCGRVGPDHGLWRYLRRNGASVQELMAFVESPCPPDIVGINHYVTSQRFLDERLDAYPAHLHGGNGRHRYVDVETVRVDRRLLDGVQARMKECWERYRLPIALTEVHLGCSREEQLRWLKQAWDAAQRVREEGVDVRAVTAWAAFGTFDWDSLVTRRSGCYEPGLWDVRSHPPRPTALAQLVHRLAHGLEPAHPVLEGRGWWQRAIRHVDADAGHAHSPALKGRLLLITGGGTLGRAFARLCHLRGLPHRLVDRAEVDIADMRSVEAAMARWNPWAIINAAGFVRVDDAERQPAQWRDNVVGPTTLARACAARDVRLVTYSSDLVFDGAKQAPYLESDVPSPLNAYGEAKAEAERCVLACDPRALVVRTAAFFGPWDRHNFLTVGLEGLRDHRRWRAAHDQVVSPTYVRDLVMSSLDLLIDDESGVWHLANRGSGSWADFAVMAAQRSGLDVSLIDAVEGKTLGQVARRPERVVLASERGHLMPTLEDALARYLTEREPDLFPS
jgi:dTDP-4-dehydrorhamnose reductase